MGGVAIIPDEERVIRHSELLVMLEGGMSIAAIARYCNVTAPTIHYHLRQMGLHYSRTKGWQKR